MGANQVFDWEQHELYADASRTQILPGGSTRYHPSRDVGLTPTDRTSFIAGQADWSPDNIPEVQYYLFPPTDRDVFRRKPILDLRDANGHIVYEQWPTQGQAARPLKDFAVLPRQVGSQDYPWIIDAWRKLDPRIQGEDILMRMDPAGRPHKWNTFQQRLGRLRPDFNVISWHATRTDPQANIPTANVLAKLQPWHFEMNTTRGLTPGLLIPELGEDGGRVPLPDYEDGRGFGREFSRRQAVNAGPNQPRRKRPRRSKPQAQAAHPSPGSQEDEDSSDEQDEQPPQRKAKRVRRASQTPTLPLPHLVTPSRDSAGHGRQNVQQAQFMDTQQAYSVHRQQPHLVHRQQPHLVDTLHAHSLDTQQPMGITLNQYPQFTRLDPGTHMAPYPPSILTNPAGRGPLRVISTTQLLGRSSSDSANVVGYSGIGHNDRQNSYHPFTRMDVRNTQHIRPSLIMDVRNTQHVPPPFAPYLSAGAHAAPSTGDDPEEPTLRHFRLPGPSPYFPQFEPEEDIAGRNTDTDRYVDPFLERFFKQYTSLVPSGFLNPIHQI